MPNNDSREAKEKRVERLLRSYFQQNLEQEIASGQKVEQKDWEELQKKIQKRTMASKEKSIRKSWPEPLAAVAACFLVVVSFLLSFDIRADTTTIGQNLEQYSKLISLEITDEQLQEFSSVFQKHLEKPGIFHP